MKILSPIKNKTEIVGIRDEIVGMSTKVPVLDGKEVEYIFFDNAASTPALKPVLDSLVEFMPWYSSVHRGSGLKSQVATKAYDEARKIVMDFFGANPRDHVAIFGKNSTEAINKLSYRLGLSKKDVVLVSLLEHHSNDLPWRRAAEVHRIAVNPQGELLESHFNELLKKYKGRVKLVAVSGASNVTGYMPDIHRLAEKTHAAGAQILVDCAQLAPHRKIDMRSLDDSAHLDYVVISAHKMYAPFGTGALIGRKDTFAHGAPELCGGGTIDVVTTSEVVWTAAPEREEAGTPNVVGAVALAKSLQVLSEISMSKVAAHEAELTAYTLRKLNKIKGLKLFGGTSPEDAASRLGVIPLAVEGLPNGLVAAILSEEWGIGVRNGCFCAHPYVTRLLGITSKDFRDEIIAGDRSHMPGLVRISFGMYNKKGEVDRLAEALEKIARQDYIGSYRQDKSTGEYHAQGWEPDLSRFFSL